MVNVNIINNSSIYIDAFQPLVDEVTKRIDSIDFEKFKITKIQLYVIVDADKESIRYTTRLSETKKYLLFQGIPKEYAYNSSFEAKLSTIRLRLQNIDICDFASSIDNIVFVVDFKQTNSLVNSDSESHDELDKVFHNIKSSIRKNVIRPKGEVEDNDENRKASFIPVTPKFTLDNVIMTTDMKKQIEDALSIIRNRKKIYEEWGFGEIDPQPKAILSFWGPPGTGKTMCAHAIANSMGTKILAVNYAEIESKYAGESPKNLSAAFNAAQENNAVLFFDEADSFLGKRISNVQSGHDQSINSLRSQMLILLENFEGIVIFATNLVKNFDKAFETRILRHIKFELPDSHTRKAIFQKLIPSKLPLERLFDENDYELLATTSDGFSGRDIRNSVLDAMSAAARNNKEKLSIDDFVSIIQQRQESYKKLKEEHNSDNKKIAEDIKNSIIEKSKKDLNEALVGVAVYSAFADDSLDPKKETLVKDFATAMGVTLPDIISLDYMPPLSHIVEYFNTKDKKYRAIDIAARMIAIDCKITENEGNFLVHLCNMLGMKESERIKITEYVHSLVLLNSQWNKIVKQ